MPIYEVRWTSKALFNGRAKRMRGTPHPILTRRTAEAADSIEMYALGFPLDMADPWPQGCGPSRRRAATVSADRNRSACPKGAAVAEVAPAAQSIARTSLSAWSRSTGGAWARG